MVMGIVMVMGMGMVIIMGMVVDTKIELVMVLGNLEKYHRIWKTIIS